MRARQTRLRRRNGLAHRPRRRARASNSRGRIRPCSGRAPSGGCKRRYPPSCSFRTRSAGMWESTHRQSRPCSSGSPSGQWSICRRRDAGHGRAAQREELLQLLFRQVVDGKQRALFLHRIFRGKLDNVRCVCYGGLRRRSRVRFGRRRGGSVFTGHRLDLRNAFFIYICSLDPYLVSFRINDRFRQEVRAVDFLFYYNEWRLIIH